MLIDPVGITDIARRAGVKRDTAKKWTERKPDGFPEPHPQKIVGRRVWEWSAIHSWLMRTGRL